MSRGTGIYRKFNVTRSDGEHESGRKHDGCRYFVLDLDCDKHARSAIAAYAESCAESHPELSADLKSWLEYGDLHL